MMDPVPEDGDSRRADHRRRHTDVQPPRPGRRLRAAPHASDPNSTAHRRCGFIGGRSDSGRATGVFGVTYVRNPMGRGHTAESRAIGVSLCSEDIIAFLDDDANARPDWLVEILRRYDQRSVAGVGGSALNGYPGEREEGLGSIGCLLPDGRMTGHFAADPGRDVDVDHLLGANMSYRRAAIDQVGGIRGGYPGTCLREESDLALRVAKSGGRLVYTPDAIVDHLPANTRKERGSTVDTFISPTATRSSCSAGCTGSTHRSCGDTSVSRSPKPSARSDAPLGH